MCSGVLSSALWHLHLHGIILQCVHGHGALHWTLDTAAALELDAESPALACAWHDTLGTTAPAAARTSLDMRLQRTLDTPPWGSTVQRKAARTSLGMRLLWVGLDDDSLDLAFALGLSSACNLGVTVSLGLGLFLVAGVFLW